MIVGAFFGLIFAIVGAAFAVRPQRAGLRQEHEDSETLVRAALPDVVAQL